MVNIKANLSSHLQSLQGSYLGFVAGHFDEVAHELFWQTGAVWKGQISIAANDVPGQIDCPLFYIGQRVKQSDSACLRIQQVIQRPDERMRRVGSLT